MLQSRPMTAPGRTCANAQTRVPGPTRVLSRRAFGWTNTPSGFLFSIFEVFTREHHVVGPSLRVLERPPQIPPQHTNAKAVQPTEEQYQGRHGRVARDRQREEQLGDEDGHTE